jgi:hypothetical protein
MVAAGREGIMRDMPTLTSERGKRYGRSGLKSLSSSVA